MDSAAGPCGDDLDVGRSGPQGKRPVVVVVVVVIVVIVVVTISYPYCSASASSPPHPRPRFLFSANPLALHTDPYSFDLASGESQGPSSIAICRGESPLGSILQFSTCG